MRNLGMKLGLTGYSGAKSLAARALSAIRRNGGTLLLPGLPRNWLDSAGTIAATVDNPVGLVQDSVGSNHATQPTTASKPILRRTSGRYAWQFDGSNDFLQTGITTGNEGWVCAGVTPMQVTTAATVFNAGATSDTAKGVWLYAFNGNWIFRVGNGSDRVYPGLLTASVGVPAVVSGGWTASTLTLDKDGTSVSTERSGDCTSPTTMIVGRSMGGMFHLNGSMSATVYCPVLPSAADRALIRRFVGSLQGQQL